jgi:hypothetical protein
MNLYVIMNNRRIFRRYSKGVPMRCGDLDGPDPDLGGDARREA